MNSEPENKPQDDSEFHFQISDDISDCDYDCLVIGVHTYGKDGTIINGDITPTDDGYDIVFPDTA